MRAIFAYKARTVYNGVSSDERMSSFLMCLGKAHMYVFNTIPNSFGSCNVLTIVYLLRAFCDGVAQRRQEGR